MKNEVSAFPQIGSDYNENTGGVMSIYSDGGMTLRDYFAGQALVGLLACPLETALNKPDFAGESYRYADAMLAEREKQQGRQERHEL